MAIILGKGAISPPPTRRGPYSPVQQQETEPTGNHQLLSPDFSNCICSTHISYCSGAETPTYRGGSSFIHVEQPAIAKPRARISAAPSNLHITDFLNCWDKWFAFQTLPAHLG